MIAPRSRTGRLLRRIGSTPWARRVLGPKVLTRLDHLAMRVTGGRWRPSDLLFDTLELTTTGRRSGRPRSSTLAAFEQDGHFVVIGSNFGHPPHPAWSHNLLEDPRAIVNHHGDVRPVVARLLTGEERRRAWETAVELWPGYEVYREAVDGIREIRVFALEVEDDRTA